jgi:phosphate starvation-inducible PhoH-like protein
MSRARRQPQPKDNVFPFNTAPGDSTEPAPKQRFVKSVTPKTENQKVLMDMLTSRDVILALGPAGSGKTYLAIAAAVEALEHGVVERIVLSRPAVEAGENLGFLPGDLEDKLAPYLRPLYDALVDRMGGKRLRAGLANRCIEIAPIAFMRGRTLNNAFVVIDEAQNCTSTQLKMLLSRLGANSTMVLTGDPDQTDLEDEASGLQTVADKLAGIEQIGVVQMVMGDIVRHPLVSTMLTVL